MDCNGTHPTSQETRCPNSNRLNPEFSGVRETHGRKPINSKSHAIDGQGDGCHRGFGPHANRSPAPTHGTDLLGPRPSDACLVGVPVLRSNNGMAGKDQAMALVCGNDCPSAGNYRIRCGCVRSRPERKISLDPVSLLRTRSNIRADAASALQNNAALASIKFASNLHGVQSFVQAVLRRLLASDIWTSSTVLHKTMAFVRHFLICRKYESNVLGSAFEGVKVGRLLHGQELSND